MIQFLTGMLYSERILIDIQNLSGKDCTSLTNITLRHISPIGYNL